MNNIRIKNSGITLIALIVTIIILLILASISITTLTGDNGILRSATDAREQSRIAESKEKIEAIVALCFGRKGNIKYDKLKEELENIGANVSNENYPIWVELNGNKFEIDEEGNVILNDLAGLDEIEITYENQDLIGLSNNTSISNFEIPKTCEKDGKQYKITSLGDSFAYNISLNSVRIPDTVKRLNDYAFYWSRVKEVYIPKSVVEFKDDLFSNCFYLQSFHVDENNPVIKDIDGVLYTKSGKTLIVYPASKTVTKYTIPSGVEAIGSCAFYYTSGIEEIEIPTTVKRIKYNAFCESGDLETVIIPDSVEELGRGIFWGCTNLTTVSLPSNLTKIPDSTFSDCNNLESIQIPTSVTEIGDYAFFENYKLGTIQIPENVSKIGENAFFSANATISFDNYRNIIEVGDYAFYGCNMNNDAKNYILSLNPNAFKSENQGIGSVMSYTFAEQ